MPNTASCCSSGYCVAGKYCDEDGCCPNGRKCAAPTTLISLAPESKTSTSTSPATTVSDPAASSSAIVEPPKHTEAGNSLSTGAKAGIGVGAGIGGLAILIGIAFLVVMARKRKQAKRADGGQLQPPENPPVTPMIPPEMSPSPLKQELDSKNIPAIVRPKSDATLVSSLSPVSPNQTNNVVYELDGTTGPRSELVGSPVSRVYQLRREPIPWVGSWEFSGYFR